MHMEADEIRACPEESSFRARIKSFYRKHEKYHGLVLFAAGFIWDSLTLTRVDNLVDNLILLSYLVLIGTVIFLVLRRQCGGLLPGWLAAIEPRFLWVIQFCFGGLFSSYVIFYFKSASWTRTQFFFLVLVFLWIGNEFLEQRLQNRELLASLYLFCLFTFLAFFLPVVLTRVDLLVFLAAGVISLVVCLSLFGLGLSTQRNEWRRRMLPIAVWTGSVFLTLNILYFANLIPPVPLALKSAGIYHSVRRTPEGYEVKYVAPPLLQFWKKWDDPFILSPGEKAYCFTAVFAPGGVRIPVVHVWSRKTEAGWQRTDRIRFPILGGREGGYRGFTAKKGIAPGKWRVEVQTERGQTLGRINFTIVESPDVHPPLETKLIE